jgi:hypothetical protein
MAPKLSLSFTPAHFIALLERERRWFELLMTAMFTRAELRNLDPKLADGNAVTVFLELRTTALRS